MRTQDRAPGRRGDAARVHADPEIARQVSPASRAPPAGPAAGRRAPPAGPRQRPARSCPPAVLQGQPEHAAIERDGGLQVRHSHTDMIDVRQVREFRQVRRPRGSDRPRGRGSPGSRSPDQGCQTGLGAPRGAAPTRCPRPDRLAVRASWRAVIFRWDGHGFGDRRRGAYPDRQAARRVGGSVGRPISAGSRSPARSSGPAWPLGMWTTWSWARCCRPAAVSSRPGRPRSRAASRCRCRPSPSTRSACRV